MTPGPTVLVIEDEVAMRRLLRATLEAHGYVVVEATTIAEGRRQATSAGPHLIVLDLGLPDGDGLELVVGLRVWTTVPIIVVTARDREADKIRALDAGADDYVIKPFATGELLARMRVALRHAEASKAPAPAAVLTVGPLRLDHDRHEVTVERVVVHLTPIEFRLLGHLMQHAGKVLTHRQLLREVWGASAVEQTHYLRVHMAALRRKIEPDPGRPHWLLTEPGVGYRLRDDDSATT